MSRIINTSGLEIIKEFEGCKLEAYQDGNAVWTIGTGHTGGVKAGDTCSQMQADAWLEQDLIGAEEAVSRLVKVPLTDNQFSALVCFVFNIGQGNFAKSTLLKKLNAGDYASVPICLSSWVFINGKVSPGLSRRRKAEADLWSKESVNGRTV